MYFDSGNVSTKFYFDENNKKAGYIEMRLMGVETLREINKRTTKKRIEYKRGQRFEVDDKNEDLENELIWDYCITGWDNLVDAEGKVEKCTKENKVKYSRCCFRNPCMNKRYGYMAPFVLNISKGKKGNPSQSELNDLIGSWNRCV